MNTSRRKFLATLAGGSAVIFVGRARPCVFGPGCRSRIGRRQGHDSGRRAVDRRKRRTEYRCALQPRRVSQGPSQIGDSRQRRAQDQRHDRAASVGARIVGFAGRRETCNRARCRLSGSQPVAFRIDGCLAHLPAQGESALDRLVGTISRCLARIR